MDKSDILFEKYYEDVLRFLRGLSRDEQLAEELTQETIYRAIKSIHMFKGDSDMRVWLCSIAKNLYFTYRKKQKYVTYSETYENYEAENYLCKYWKTEKQRSKYFRIEKISLYGSFNSCKIYSIQ